MKKDSTNTFSEGLIQDLNPIATPTNVLTDCLNGTLLTFNGNELILQNDMGNAAILNNPEDPSEGVVSLKEGFIPMGIKEYGGVLYIISQKPDESGEGEFEIGSFPSPIYTETEYTPQNYTFDININLDGTDSYNVLNKLIPISVISKDGLPEELKLYPGDTFRINILTTTDPEGLSQSRFISSQYDEKVGENIISPSNEKRNYKLQLFNYDDGFNITPTNSWFTLNADGSNYIVNKLPNIKGCVLALQIVLEDIDRFEISKGHTLSKVNSDNGQLITVGLPDFTSFFSSYKNFYIPDAVDVKIWFKEVGGSVVKFDVTADVTTRVSLKDCVEYQYTIDGESLDGSPNTLTYKSNKIITFTQPLPAKNVLFYLEATPRNVATDITYSTLYSKELFKLKTNLIPILPTWDITDQSIEPLITPGNADRPKCKIQVIGLVDYTNNGINGGMNWQYGNNTRTNYQQVGFGELLFDASQNDTSYFSLVNKLTIPDFTKIIKSTFNVKGYVNCRANVSIPFGRSLSYVTPSSNWMMGVNGKLSSINIDDEKNTAFGISKTLNPYTSSNLVGFYSPWAQNSYSYMYKALKDHLCNIGTPTNMHQVLFDILNDSRNTSKYSFTSSVTNRDDTKYDELFTFDFKIKISPKNFNFKHVVRTIGLHVNSDECYLEFNNKYSGLKLFPKMYKVNSLTTTREKLTKNNDIISDEAANTSKIKETLPLNGLYTEINLFGQKETRVYSVGNLSALTVYVNPEANYTDHFVSFYMYSDISETYKFRTNGANPIVVNINPGYNRIQLNYDDVVYMDSNQQPYISLIVDRDSRTLHFMSNISIIESGYLFPVVKTFKETHQLYFDETTQRYDGWFDYGKNVSYHSGLFVYCPEPFEELDSVPHFVTLDPNTNGTTINTIVDGRTYKIKSI